LRRSPPLTGGAPMRYWSFNFQASREWRFTMRSIERWRVTGTLVLLIGFIALASSQFLNTPAKAADPIKIGWVGPLSPPGGYAEGALMKQAAEVAAEELNAKGGLLGRPIQLIVQDTRRKPEDSTAT